MDFTTDTRADGRNFRTLNIVDDFTRECVAIEVDRSLPGLRVTRVLDRLAVAVGLPQTIVVAPTSRASMGSFADECLNEHWFVNLVDAKTVIEAWRVDYNTVRPHSSLGGRTPDQFAAISGGARGPRPARTHEGLKSEDLALAADRM